MLTSYETLFMQMIFVNIAPKGLTANYLLGIDYFGQIATAFISKNNTSTQPDGFGRRLYNTKNSEFTYGTNATNPLWARANSAVPNFKSRPDFGRPQNLALDLAEGRFTFYFNSEEDLGELSHPNG